MALNDVDGLMVGGDVKIYSIKLFNYKNLELDLTTLFTEVEIFENIYSHGLSGSVTLVDTHNLIKVFPIIGEERMEIVYKTPGFPDEYKISQAFYVYKLANFVNPTPHRQIYTLYFCSPETVIDVNKKISKAFSGTATKIIGSLLGVDGLNTNKKFELEQSSNSFKFVSPFWTPFKNISYAMERAQTSDISKSSNFVFFETNKKYKFKSINSIFDPKNKSNIDYKYSSDTARAGAKNTSRDVAAELTKIYAISEDHRFNSLENTQAGAYSHTMWNHNLLLKTVTRKTYDYHRDFNKTNHLGNAPPISALMQYSSNNMMSSTTTYPKLHDAMTEDNFANTMTTRMPLMAQLNMSKYEITVNGRTDLEVGDVVDVSIAGMEVLSNRDKYETLTNNSDGRYLVTSIKHRITMQKHQMTLKIIKESVNEQYR